MTNPTILIAICLMAVAFFFFPALIYWEECSEGYSHEASLTIASILIGLFIGSNSLGYAAVVSMYS